MKNNNHILKQIPSRTQNSVKVRKAYFKYLKGFFLVHPALGSEKVFRAVTFVLVNTLLHYTVTKLYFDCYLLLETNPDFGHLNQTFLVEILTGL